MTTTAESVLRIAEAITGLPEEFRIVHELRAALKDLVTITAAKESQP